LDKPSESRYFGINRINLFAFFVKVFQMLTPSYSKNKQAASSAPIAGRFSLFSIVAWLFAIQEREALDAKTGGDKSDGRYTWGL
jgi:hypothetical protein